MSIASCSPLMTLENMPGCESAIERIEAWFEHELLDRPPVRFSMHNADYAGGPAAGRPQLAGPEVALVRRRVPGRLLHRVDPRPDLPRRDLSGLLAEPRARMSTRPSTAARWSIGEVTSWIRHCIRDWDDVARLKFSRDNVYFRKIEEMTRLALEKCDGRFLVGYTDLHGSLDCVMDWRGPEQLCLDLADCPEKVHELRRSGQRELPADLRSLRRAC